MEDIAARSGLTKRTLYKNYADKHALFSERVHEAMRYTERRLWWRCAKSSRCPSAPPWCRPRCRTSGSGYRHTAAGFEHLAATGALRAADPRRAAQQFAYLVVGAPLDRAILLDKVPPKAEILACAREGVETFLARYAARAGRGTR